MTDRDTHPSLESLRQDIADLDRRLLSLLGERQALAGKIGEVKNRAGIPLRNYEVEAEVHARMRGEAVGLELDPELGHDLAAFLIEKSVATQASLRDLVYAGEYLDCAVIGGKGGMGRWISDFLASQGHAVAVIDPASALTAHKEVEGLRAAKDFDLVVVAVPMDACGAVLGELASHAVRGVVVELASLKAHLEVTFASVRDQGLRLVSLHPLFGPATEMLEGRRLVLCTDGAEADREVVRGLFASTSAELVEMSTAEHDRRMATVLGLSHLGNLVFARALSHSGFSFGDLAEVAGVTFEKQVETTREVCRENQELYYQIQDLNPTTEETVQWLEEALADYRDAIVRRAPIAFTEFMDEAREFFEG